MAAPILDIRTVGGAVNDPVSDQDSNGENMLDIAMVAYTWWHLTGTPANIVFVIGPNASGGMKLVTDEIISAGCLSASWSWGSAALGWDPGERALLSASFAAGVAAGCTFCAAAGDNSIDDGLKTASTDVPCSDINVLAVGGTKLVLNTDGTILVESAWGDGAPGDEGGGGGFDPSTPVPAWQSGVVPANSPGRGVPDVSANADPQSGYQVPSNGAWGVIGGTSASSPLIATVIGVAKSAYGQQQGLLSPLVYANGTAACRDIVKGSNGDDAAPGWDPATGCGSPNGEAFITALVGSLPRVAVAP